MEAVYIQWIDSCAYNRGGWFEPTDDQFTIDALLYESVGWLFKETDYSYVIVQSKGVNRDEQPHVDMMMEIPKCAVKEFRKYG